MLRTRATNYVRAHRLNLHLSRTATCSLSRYDYASPFDAPFARTSPFRTLECRGGGAWAVLPRVIGNRATVIARRDARDFRLTSRMKGAQRGQCVRYRVRCRLTIWRRRNKRTIHASLYDRSPRSDDHRETITPSSSQPPKILRALMTALLAGQFSSTLSEFW